MFVNHKKRQMKDFNVTELINIKYRLTKYMYSIKYSLKNPFML